MIRKWKARDTEGGMGQANERKMKGKRKENEKEMEGQRHRGRDGTGK